VGKGRISSEYFLPKDPVIKKKNTASKRSSADICNSAVIQTKKENGKKGFEKVDCTSGTIYLRSMRSSANPSAISSGCGGWGDGCGNNKSSQKGAKNQKGESKHTCRSCRKAGCFQFK